MTSIYTHIGSKIRAFREAYSGKGISQEELAEKLSVSPNTVSRWETATYKPKISDLKKMSNFFNVPIAEFFPEDNKKDDNKWSALMSATADLHPSDIEALIEFAEFRRLRKVLENPNKKK